MEAPTTLRGRLRFMGPSLILTATLIGSGERILTTILGARVGFAALWVIILSCVLKVPLQESFGRHTISSGDTTLLAINRLPGPRFIVSWIVWFWLGGILLTTAQLGAIATLVGESLSMILPAIDSRRWAPIVCAVALLMLRSGHYQVVERFSTFMVACFSTLTILCAILIQWTPFAVTGEQLLGEPAISTPSCRVGDRSGHCRLCWPELNRVDVLPLLVPGKAVCAIRRSELAIDRLGPPCSGLVESHAA